MTQVHKENVTRGKKTTTAPEGCFTNCSKGSKNSSRWFQERRKQKCPKRYSVCVFTKQFPHCRAWPASWMNTQRGRQQHHPYRHGGIHRAATIDSRLREHVESAFPLFLLPSFALLSSLVSKSFTLFALQDCEPDFCQTHCRACNHRCCRNKKCPELSGSDRGEKKWAPLPRNLSLFSFSRSPGSRSTDCKKWAQTDGLMFVSLGFDRLSD